MKDEVQEPPQARIGAIGLTDKEIARFSLQRLLAELSGVAKPGAAAFERECCDHVKKVVNEIRRQQNTQDLLERGIYLPAEIMSRTLTATGGVASGGAVVQTTVSKDDWAPALRAAAVVKKLGAQVHTSSASVALARTKPGGVPAAVAENAAPGGSDLMLELVTYAPNTIANFMVASKRLLSVTGTLAESVIQTDLYNAIEEYVDRYAIQGTGSSGQPLGILNTSGVNTIALGTNGAAPTYASVVDCIRQVGLKNALKTTQACGWVTNTKFACTARNITKTASWGFIWDDAQQPEYDGWICGYPALMTESVPSNLTKGSGTNLSAAIFGDWSELYIVEFSPIAILPDPYTYSNTGAVRFNVFQDVDIRPRRVDSFSIIVDAIAA